MPTKHTTPTKHSLRFEDHRSKHHIHPGEPATPRGNSSKLDEAPNTVTLKDVQKSAKRLWDVMRELPVVMKAAQSKDISSQIKYAASSGLHDVRHLFNDSGAKFFSRLTQSADGFLTRMVSNRPEILGDYAQRFTSAARDFLSTSFKFLISQAAKVVPVQVREALEKAHEKVLSIYTKLTDYLGKILTNSLEKSAGNKVGPMKPVIARKMPKLSA